MLVFIPSDPRLLDFVHLNSYIVSSDCIKLLSFIIHLYNISNKSVRNNEIIIFMLSNNKYYSVTANDA